MAVGCNRHMHVFLMGVRAVAVIALLLCLIAHGYTIYKSSTDDWFTDCSECKNKAGACPGSRGKPTGEETCVECCCDCSMRETATFYMRRSYSMCFAALALAAEAELDCLSYRTDPAKPPLFLILKYYWARGVLMIFVGFLTVESGEAPGGSEVDGKGITFVKGAGWTLLAVGIVNIILSLACGITVKDDEEQGGQRRGSTRA
eukprot:Hpha_TRINITY_DN3387_c0_g2::TRINITY_DN3387_c0_g2_i1::g.172230::m.172230